MGPIHYGSSQLGSPMNTYLLIVRYPARLPGERSFATIGREPDEYVRSFSRMWFGVWIDGEACLREAPESGEVSRASRVTS